MWGLQNLIGNAIKYGNVDRNDCCVKTSVSLAPGFNPGNQRKAETKLVFFYKSHGVGEYYADLIVDNKVIIEIKAVEGLVEEHELQLINYLKATNIEIGLLLNFGRRPQLKRKVFTNNPTAIEHTCLPQAGITQMQQIYADNIRDDLPDLRHPRSITWKN